MPTIYSARWVLPVSAPPIEGGAVAVDGQLIVGVGPRAQIADSFPGARLSRFDNALITPGLVNTHTHLELTAMRGYLENEERDFFSWLRKLTLGRLERMTPDDIFVSVAWGACEAARAGITCVADASDSALISMRALLAVGLRGIVFQESFGPDPRLVNENLEGLRTKIAQMRELETKLVQAGVSPHAPYTVCAPQLEAIAEFAGAENLALMMHAAESTAEESMVRDGCGLFVEGLAKRGIDWRGAGTSTIEYLKQRGILKNQPLLAHCIRVDDNDIETLAETGSKIAHCPKSNAKLGHGHAPLARFLDKGVSVGLGSDSVASNNTCDILEEARFAVLLSRAFGDVRDNGDCVGPRDVFIAATQGGASCLGFSNQIGELKEGLQADFTVISLAGAHQWPSYDPVASAVFTSSGRDVILTVVAGAEVYRDGRVTNVDEDRLRARMHEIGQKLEKGS